jgi:Uma2 family endonuclease
MEIGVFRRAAEVEVRMAEERAHGSASIAPWAEIVPEAGPMTVDGLLRLPDDAWQYEVVEGRLVRMPPGGLRASSLTVRLAAHLWLFVEREGLGLVTGSDGLYDLTPAGTPPARGTGLAPDVGFVEAAHLPPHVVFDEDRAVPFAPDLAVEVASPSQYRPAMARKAQRYLSAGTRLVWIVWPRRREVDVWRPGDMQPSQVLNEGKVLDGEGVVPGFTYPVSDLFG